MSDTLCAATLRWLTGAQSPPPDELVAHVADCARCRGALAVTFGALASMPAETALDCGTCEEELPAYLEYERARGAAAAARSYPQVWWHLWHCAECAEQARLTTVLLVAEAEGALAAPPRAVTPAARWPFPPIRLSRDFLSDLFVPQTALGAAWSGESPRTLIAEDDLPGHRIAIYVRQRDAQSCDLEIGIEPPRTGAVVVTFGAAIFRAAFSAGWAQLEALPIELFIDHSQPDMLITVEGGHQDGRAG